MAEIKEQQRSKERHQRILDAALEVFTRQGYREAAVDEIAMASGSSKGGVYFHFPNKSAIFHALLRRSAALLLSRTEAAVARVDDPVARVDAALLTVLRLFAEHRSLARLFLVDALGAGSEFSAALMAVHSDFARLITRHLDEAVSAGAIAPLDSKLAGTVWFGALNEVVVRWLLTGEPERLEDAYPSLRALLLHSVGAPLGRRSYGSLSVVAPAPPFAAALLRARLVEGRQRARQRQRPVLVSISAVLDPVDPLTLFAQGAALAQDRLYWERPEERVALAGLGVAHTVGGPSLIEVAQGWRTLLGDAVIDDGGVEVPGQGGGGPLLLGGFAFDPLRPTDHGGPWDGFPLQQLVLPRLTLRTLAGRSTLTVNAVVAANSEIETEAARLLRWCEALFPLDPRGSDSGLPSGAVATHDDRPRRRWEEAVDRAARRCAEGGRHDSTALRKVVLARTVTATSETPFDPVAVLDRLRAAYPGSYTFAVAHGVRCFVGATPERLVRRRDCGVEIASLAGSAPRGASPEEDAYLGNALLASEKDRFEHSLVVQGIRAALDGVATQVEAAAAPQLLRLQNVQHLYTPITAQVPAATSVLDLVARLHPTPAVGGLPRAAALSYLRDHENLDRGLYAGPFGWVDRHGHGEFAVALRCGLLRGGEATLFAGCGIVADSQPADEYAETTIKLRPMLTALRGQNDDEER